MSVHSVMTDDVMELLSTLATLDIRLALDGDALRVTAPKGALTAELKAAIAEHKPTLLTRLRGSAPRALQATGQPVSRTLPLPVAYAQREMWFLNQLHPSGTVHNLRSAHRISGALDVDQFVDVLTRLPARHEALWMRFQEEDGSPQVRLADAGPTPVRFVDLSQLSHEDREKEARALQLHFVTEPFDLAQGPLLRWLLIRCSADEHLFVLCVHHIAADGWSLSVLLNEIAAQYDEAVSGRMTAPAGPSLQFLDFAEQEREQERTGAFERDLSHWTTSLRGAPACLDLPLDRPRPAVRSDRGARAEYTIDRESLDALRAAARANDMTLFMFTLACWQILLHRLSGASDVVVGTPVATRDDHRFDGAVGCFINTLAFRGSREGVETVAEYLAATRHAVSEGFQHRTVPFDLVSRSVQTSRSAAFAPVFQVMFSMHSFPPAVMHSAGVTFEPIAAHEHSRRTTGHDVVLELEETGTGLAFTYEYAADLLDAETIDRWHAHYQQVLLQVARDITQRIDDIPLLTASDDRELFDTLNATITLPVATALVHDLVSAHAKQRPAATAVRASDATLSYVDLERQSNQLAQLLRVRGVVDGDRVGVCLDRQAALPAVLLAVLKAGAAYVPVDPTHPTERIAYTLADAGVACVITDTPSADAVEGVVPLLLLDADALALEAQPTDAPATSTGSDDLAYVIYTSGSTGRPKGVEVTHRNLVSFLQSMAIEPGFDARDVLLAVTTPSFDIAGLELFLPLVCGGTTVIASRIDTIDGGALAQNLVEHQVTVMQATPSTWRLMIAAGWQGTPGLRILCGGEALPVDLAAELLPRCAELWNMYGPTETTVWSTLHRVTDASSPIPIGRPIGNTVVVVVDAQGRPTPVGVAGELWIGGAGVARGYHARPDLTAEKFVSFQSSVSGAPRRMYRTGDIVRIRNSRVLEYVGRRDHQVKLRGFRIELGEIENLLATLPAVRQAVVSVREDVPGDQRLVAYVIPATQGRLDAKDIRRALRLRLPQYMVPTAIVELAAFPLTPNGKIDRKALPAPAVPSQSAVPGAASPVVPVTPLFEPARLVPGAAPSAPSPSRDRIEAQLIAIWCELLGVPQVQRDDNFFELGGHSLMGARVLARIQAAFGQRLPLRAIFDAPTVGELAALITVETVVARRELEL